MESQERWRRLRDEQRRKTDQIGHKPRLHFELPEGRVPCVGLTSGTQTALSSGLHGNAQPVADRRVPERERARAELPAEPPSTNLRRRRGALDPGADSRVVQTLQGMIDFVDARERLAEVVLYQDGHAVPYLLPREHFERECLERGDAFVFEVVCEAGAIGGRIRRPEPAPASLTLVDVACFKTPEELTAESDPWDR